MPESKRVAVVMQPVRLYCRGVLRGVASVSTRARWECILIAADAPPPVVDLAGFVHGLIGHFSEKLLLEHVARSRVPAVDISPARRGARLPRVTTDDAAVGRLAATHLLSLGLTNFGFFGTRESHYSQLREQGFSQTLGAAGVACHVLLNGTLNDGSNGNPATRVEGGAKARRGAPPAHEPLEDWVRRLPKPIGIMASTDSRALDLLAVCRKLGLDVPGSVAVLGVDNDDVFCELANPPLSSIALSTLRIGYEAARMLDRLMAGETLEEDEVLVPPAGVVSRRSSDIPSLLDPAEIRRAQVETARQMLAETDEPMSRVAVAAGFINAKQLGAIFHREEGVTPSAHRRRIRAQPLGPR